MYKEIVLDKNQEKLQKWEFLENIFEKSFTYNTSIFFYYFCPKNPIAKCETSVFNVDSMCCVPKKLRFRDWVKNGHS